MNEIKRAFIALFDLCCLAAFSSLFVQARGLYSNEGVVPLIHDNIASCDSFFSCISAFRSKPTLLIFCKFIGIGHGAAFEALALLGTLVSLLGFVGFACVPVQVVIYLLYLSLYTAGGEFTKFMWDVLLLELAVVAVFLAPMVPAFITLTQENPKPAPYPGLRAPLQLLHAVFFKITFMNGVVKLKSGCPAWLNLTALHYHFSTQPLPSPSSWYLHNAPPSWLRALAALMLVVEIPGALLMLLPGSGPRRVSYMMQCAMQAFILLSGNYNFYVFLTLIAGLVLLADDYTEGRVSIDTGRAGKKRIAAVQAAQAAQAAAAAAQAAAAVQAAAKPPKTPPASGSNTPTRPIHKRPIGKPVTLKSPIPSAFAHSPLHRIGSTVWAGLRRYYTPLWLAAAVFVSLSLFRHDPSGKLPVVTLDAKALQHKLAAYLQPLLILGLIGICLRSYEDVRVRVAVSDTDHPRRPGDVLGAALVSACCILVFSLHLVSLGTLEPDSMVEVMEVLPMVKAAYLGAEPWRVSGSYGLFRKMQGVADRGEGWAASRLELALEGSQDGEDWAALRFRYKPGPLDVAPPVVVPHQPRLDWQLHYAALAKSYLQAPWFVSLSQQLLLGSPSVRGLLHPASPYVQGPPPKYLRATLLQYELTRARGWGRERGCKGCEGPLEPLPSGGKAWWHAAEVLEFMPPVKACDPIALEVLKRSKLGGDRGRCLEVLERRTSGKDEGPRRGRRAPLLEAARRGGHWTVWLACLSALSLRYLLEPWLGPSLRADLVAAAGLDNPAGFLRLREVDPGVHAKKKKVD